MSGRSKTLTFALPTFGALALIGGATLVYAGRPVVEDELPPRPPTQAPGDASSATRFIGAVGLSEPAGEAVQVAAHLPGIVVEVPVVPGQRLEAGAPLLRIDDDLARRELELRQAEVDVARAELESLRADAEPRRARLDSAAARVGAAEAGVAVARAVLADARNRLAIAEGVRDERAISREELDRRRFGVQEAEARLSTAEADVATARAGVAEARTDLELVQSSDLDVAAPQVLAAERRIAQAEAQVARTRVDLERLTLRAPFAAEVLQVNVRPGEFAPAAAVPEGLVVLGADAPPHLRVELDEVDIARFRPEAAAWASPRGNAGRRLRLELVRVEPLVVPKSNLSGGTSERVDTRVLQVVYRFAENPELKGLGQQFDVYIEVPEGGQAGS